MIGSLPALGFISLGSIISKKDISSKEKDLKFIELSAFLIGGKMILHGREVEIQVDDIEPFVNEKYKGFKILWSGSIGFG